MVNAIITAVLAGIISASPVQGYVDIGTCRITE